LFGMAEAMPLRQTGTIPKDQSDSTTALAGHSAALASCIRTQDGLRNPVSLFNIWMELSFDDFASADAGSADPDPGVAAIHDRAHAVQIHVPPPLRDVVGVADLVSKPRAFPAHITNFCHFAIS